MSLSLHQSTSTTLHPPATYMQNLASATTFIRPLFQKPESNMTVAQPKIEAAHSLSPQYWQGEAVARSSRRMKGAKGCLSTEKNQV